MIKFRGGLLLPSKRAKSGFKFIRDGAFLYDDGEVLFLGEFDKVPSGLKSTFKGVKWGRRVLAPGIVNSHSHVLQPPAVPGQLIFQEGKRFKGWLPETLQTETLIKKNPKLARGIAQVKFKSYLENGITGSLEYTTSSVAAVREILRVAAEMGFGGRIKVGYVCMDQGVDFINGVSLEENAEDALAATRALLDEFPGQVVVIDRFPIAVSSFLRRQLADLARERGVLYETHMDESENEAKIHKSIYGSCIVDTLIADGVFKPGSRVGLAHAIHTTTAQRRKIAGFIADGCEVWIRACPNSNAQLQSHVLSNGKYVSFPLKEWQEIGAKVTFGLDNGAGRGVNLFAEALFERGRPHPGGYVPSYTELLKILTVNGAESLRIDSGFIIVEPAGAAFDSDLPQDLEQLCGAIIEGGQDSEKVKSI